MRKLVVIGFVIAGAAIGLLSSLGETLALKVFMMGLGALIGAIAGAAPSRIGRGRPTPRRDDALRGLGTSSQDLMENYWRDEGHPQFMKPPSPDSKQFGGTGGMAD
ncbi:hypothetical protein [Thauera butanivorans]|jgi:hypothetical protein|uniref:hypothetical protein n=1 Tax=Thauera butanivorans TaxID=86174 RepID=UPI000837F07C|nr:hypothetical protein [Thauera butanivorans]